MSSQSSVFPLTPSVDAPEPESRTVDLFTEDGRRMLDALGSETARAIVSALAEEPGTTSELADRVGTSLQNAHYHLDRLEDADLVQVAGTHYSTRGSEMDVYAPAYDPLVLVGGEDDDGAVVGGGSTGADPDDGGAGDGHEGVTAPTVGR
jgi:DNA-binding transcriptional ArsR family regulator